MMVVLSDLFDGTKKHRLVRCFLLPKNRYFYLKVVNVLPILLLSTK